MISGRAVSCDHDALGSVRNQATVAAIGQAAGVAAALSAKEGVSPRELAIDRLRVGLLAQGAYLGDESPIPAQPLAVPLPPNRGR